MKVIVIGNQSLFDIAIQEDGTNLTAFDWAVANEMSVTDSLIPGQTLINPNSQFRDVDVANYFKSKSQFIATADEIQTETSILNYGFPYGFPIAF
jgi:hypothetical protein